jgi:hypothetical protein
MGRRNRRERLIIPLVLASFDRLPLLFSTGSDLTCKQFEVPRDVKIIPETYGQFMMYLDARRRCQMVYQSADGIESKKGGVME